MSKEGRSSTSLVVISVAAGLAGVVLGSAITGYYQVKAQRLALNQAENIERYQASRALVLDLANSAVSYLSQLSSLVVMASIDPFKYTDPDDRLKEFQRAGIKLSLKTSLPAAQKILQTNVYVSQLLPPCLSQTNRPLSCYLLLI